MSLNALSKSVEDRKSMGFGPIILMFLMVSCVTMFELQEVIRGIIAISWWYSVDSNNLIDNYVKYINNSSIYCILKNNNIDIYIKLSGSGQ